MYTNKRKGLVYVVGDVCGRRSQGGNFCKRTNRSK